MEFPHLDDTRFPLLDNVNVYSYKNEFDYTRWIPNTKVKLTNVLWNSDYRDVVKFESDSARDEWFDELTDQYTVILKSNHSIPPEGGIKLPIPYDVAARYNYLVVDIPVMTSEANPIEYESVANGMRRWHFFVDEVSSRAPNTTMFVLSLDVWTQFHNDVEINYLFLERGHAPVAATDVDEYLSNPIAYNDYLLTPDVTPTNPMIARKSTMIPFGNGTKYVCMASTVSGPLLDNLGSAVASSTYTYGNITYSDLVGRDGYQLQVNGFGVGNGYDYSEMNLPAHPNITEAADARIGNNTTIWAVPATDAYGNGRFFEDVMTYCPHFMRSILACFIVDESMITKRNPRTLVGHTIYEVYGTESTQHITLSKSDFSYPVRYQRFAKLYTYPYAEIELTDNEGEVVSVRIENTGSIDVHKVASVAFPFINMRTFFTGIDGVGSNSYTWVNLWGQSRTETIPTGDWFTYCFDHEIPCYALYMDGATAWYLDNFNNRIRAGRLDALVNYHNSVRAANMAKANNDDANNTVYTNTDADATTLTTNTANTTATNTANTNITIANNSEKQQLSNQWGNAIKDAANARANTSREAANTVTDETININNSTSITCANNTNAGNVLGGAASMAAGAALAGGAMALSGAAVGATAGSIVPGAGTVAGAAVGTTVGLGIGLVQSIANAAVTSSNTRSVMDANVATASWTEYANNVDYNATVTYNDTATNASHIDASNSVNIANRTLRDHTTNNNNNLTQNNSNTATTLRNNANRSRNTNIANGGYTREMQVNNAKESLENAQNRLQLAYYDSRLSPAVPIGEYAGDPTADYMRTRGVQMRVKTMSNAEVRQVGDWFARYGYALEQIWDVRESGLVPMNHFCYWKCRDVWIDDMKSSNNAAITLMSAMFERGVTIWSNPEEIGRVSIYDN